MNKAVVSLLAVVAVLLALNLTTPGVTATPAPPSAITEAPQLVGVAVASPGHTTLVRIWSDGFAEYKVSVNDPGVEPQVWTPLPTNPNAPPSRPIAAADPGGSAIYRLWADGTVDRIPFVTTGPNVVPTAWSTEPN